MREREKTPDSLFDKFPTNDHKVLNEKSLYSFLAICHKSKVNGGLSTCGFIFGFDSKLLSQARLELRHILAGTQLRV